MEIYLEEARRAAARNQQDLADAQADLAEAMAGGDPGEILRAQQAVADAEWAIRKTALESQAELENKEYNAARALQRRAMEDRLADLQEALMKHPEQWEKINEEITTLLNNYGIDYQAAGAILGTSFAHGLRDARASIVKEIMAIAKIIRRYLRLKSPAERGPLHDLNKWWRPFAPTLLSGLDTDAIRRGALSAVSGVGPSIGGMYSRGGLSPAVGGAQAGTIVNVYNPVLLGKDREAGRMLSTVVEEHLGGGVRIGP
jgi:multidrug efflux pump subunit AcrA (membrane-fusion protein)